MDPDSTDVLYDPLPDKLQLSPREKGAIKNFARELSATLADDQPFTCLITTDDELRNLNKQFLQHDYATDVLSFPAVGELVGDIAISIERAAAQARDLGHGRAQEICVLMLHGLLHLLGYDHERDDGEMARVERFWREEFGLPQSLIERAEAAK